MNCTSSSSPIGISICLTCNESDLHHRIITCATASAGATGCVQIVSQNIKTGLYCMPCTHYPQHQTAYQQGLNVHPQPSLPQSYNQHSLYIGDILIARATHNAKRPQDCTWPKANLDLQPLLDGSLNGVSAPPPLVGGNNEPCKTCGQNDWALKGCGAEGCGGWMRRCWGCGSLGASGCGHYA